MEVIIMTIKDEYAKFFLDNQEQLFDFPVADTIDEAREFLEDCMACVFDNFNDLLDYMDSEGIDTDGLSEDNLDEVLEVFALPDGKYLFVEG